MPDRKIVLLLAASASVDPRTAARAIRDGVELLRGWWLRQRVKHAARELGVELGVYRDPAPVLRLVREG